MRERGMGSEQTFFTTLINVFIKKSPFWRTFLYIPKIALERGLTVFQNIPCYQNGVKAPILQFMIINMTTGSLSLVSGTTKSLEVWHCILNRKSSVKSLGLANFFIMRKNAIKTWMIIFTIKKMQMAI